MSDISEPERIIDETAHVIYKYVGWAVFFEIIFEYNTPVKTPNLESYSR